MQTIESTPVSCSEIGKQVDRQVINHVGFGIAAILFLLLSHYGFVSKSSIYAKTVFEVAQSTMQYGKIFIPLAVFAPIVIACAWRESYTNARGVGNNFRWTRESLKALAGPLLTLLSLISASLLLVETLTHEILPGAPYLGAIVAISSFLPAVLIGFVLDTL